MADVRVQEAGSIRVSVGDRIEDLDTPLILADLDQMERNIADWQSWMDACGVRVSTSAVIISSTLVANALRSLSSRC